MQWVFFSPHSFFSFCYSLSYFPNFSTIVYAAADICCKSVWLFCSGKHICKSSKHTRGRENRHDQCPCVFKRSFIWMYINSSRPLITAEIYKSVSGNDQSISYFGAYFMYVYKWIEKFSLTLITFLSLFFCWQEQLSEICAKCERYIGTEGGGMDQAISFTAKAGKVSEWWFYQS